MNPLFAENALADLRLRELTGTFSPPINGYRPKYGLVVLGGGTAGLVAAVGAAGLGAKVLLVEKHRLGGDCLHSGCVPSKALLEWGEKHPVPRDQTGGDFGAAQENFARAMEFLRQKRSELARNDSSERLSDLGVHAIPGEAHFSGPREITVDQRVFRFHKALIATGTRNRLLSVPGCDDPRVLTTDRIFDLSQLPDRLAILGGGPVGCEMAQAFARLGTRVSLIQSNSRLLPREPAQSSHLLRQSLIREGIEVHLETRIERIVPGLKDLDVVLSSGAEIAADLVLCAIGRETTLQTLDLDKAGIRIENGRLVLNEYLQTTNSAVYASGDVVGQWAFTHAADAMSRLFLRNGLLGIPFTTRKVNTLVIPWITWTRPRVGGVGLDPSGWENSKGERILVQAEEVDRNLLSDNEQGFYELAVDSRGKILGARGTAQHLETWLALITQAMQQGIPLGNLADAIHPYPGLAEALTKAAGKWRKEKFAKGRLRGFLGAWLGRN